MIGIYQNFWYLLSTSHAYLDMDDFSKYQIMRNNGAYPADVYRTAQKDGFNTIASIRMLREVFQLSLVDAKSIIIEADSGMSLAEHQEHLIPGLEETLENIEEYLQEGKIKGRKKGKDKG